MGEIYGGGRFVLCDSNGHLSAGDCLLVFVVWTVVWKWTEMRMATPLSLCRIHYTFKVFCLYILGFSVVTFSLSVGTNPVKGLSKRWKLYRLFVIVRTELWVTDSAVGFIRPFVKVCERETPQFQVWVVQIVALLNDTVWRRRQNASAGNQCIIIMTVG